MPRDPFAPTTLGPVTLANRIVKAATFEGMSPDNVVTDTLVEFHRRMAAGGVALTTLSYVAVSPDGMGAPAEIYVHDRAFDGLQRLASVVHGEGGKLAAQLGHAGAVGELPGKRVLGPSAGRTLTGARITPATTDDLAAIVADFGRGVAMLADAGFDAVELHFGHHYLPSSFLSPRWNRRSDGYGGSVENRARLVREILAAARAAAAGRVALTAKLNMTDAVRGGLSVEDSLAVARLLEADGGLDALELTGGGSRANQMFMFRGDPPRKEMAAVLPPSQRLGFRIAGPLLFRKDPYEEGYFLPLARRFRQALKMPLIYLGGVSTLDTVGRALDEGFDLVAMGRALVREPDLVNRMRDGAASASTCIHCNKCMVSIFSGTRCVVDHPEPLLIR